MTQNPYDPDAGWDEEADVDTSSPDGADDIDSILELERSEERDASQRSDDAADMPYELGEEDLAAAEQGNRDGDEMYAEDDTPDGLDGIEVDEESLDAFEDEPFTEFDPLRRER